VSELKRVAVDDSVQKLAYFGANPANPIGVCATDIKRIVKSLPKSHNLALAFWETNIYEMRVIASLIDPPDAVTPAQMDDWTACFDCWSICDCCCNYLYVRTPFAHSKAMEWSDDGREYVRRAGFVMMAVIALHDKKADDSAFDKFFQKIDEYSTDNRNFVKKAVNWALRQIGKRNYALNAKAIEIAGKLAQKPDRVSKWIASDAIREFDSDTTKRILARRK
jgi:3-methyladenine DNA glycosylase AlkD